MGTGRGTEEKDKMTIEIYTSMEPLNAKLVEYKGLVIVSQVKSRNIVSDIGAGLKSIVGGEIKSLSKLTEATREELLNQIREKASNMGANAIVGHRIPGLRVTVCLMGPLRWLSMGPLWHFR